MALNMGAAPCHLSVPVASLGWGDGRALHSLLDMGEYTVSGDALSLDLPAAQRRLDRLIGFLFSCNMTVSTTQSRSRIR